MEEMLPTDYIPVDLQRVMSVVDSSESAFCRFITANDVGSTGAHQAGLYIPKCASSLLFETPGVKGKNKDKLQNIVWQDELTIANRFIYYGCGSRNEYRITRFGKGFPFLKDEYIGSLFILVKENAEEYKAYVLYNDDDIETFLAHYNIGVEKTNNLIEEVASASPDSLMEQCINNFILQHSDFPTTVVMSENARLCYNNAYNVTNTTINNSPDKILLNWVDAEYQLFKAFEERFYHDIYSTPFENCQELIDSANTILNRRKSRAGKSLEHHLGHIFNTASIRFDSQAVTEGRKKPDFLFPSGLAYHDQAFDVDKLTFLGAKTTCKDRWRQVLTEANRIDHKYLFTLQQGVSSPQLKEMEDSKLTLVVPDSNKKAFPAEHRGQLLNLSEFIKLVREKQGN